MPSLMKMSLAYSDIENQLWVMWTESKCNSDQPHVWKCWVAIQGSLERKKMDSKEGERNYTCFNTNEILQQWAPK